MEQYIPKSVLVAEIEKRKNYWYYKPGLIKSRYAREEDIDILTFLNTLEVKEVDLEKEINHWQGCEAFPEGVNITPLPKAMDIVERTAKHFFELGLNTQKGE